MTLHIEVDVLLAYLSKIQCVGSSELKFQKLFDVDKSVLVVPHSSAREERVFSMVRKNKTPFCPNLALDGTLSSLLTVKLGVEKPCDKFEPNKDILESARKATWEYNRAHSSKHCVELYMSTFRFKLFIW